MGKEGTDANGPKGSRTERPHGGEGAWNPNDGKRAEPRDFDPDQATRDAERNQGRDGK